MRPGTQSPLLASAVEPMLVPSVIPERLALSHPDRSNRELTRVSRRESRAYPGGSPMADEHARSSLADLSKYDCIMVYLYRRLTKGRTPDTFPSELLFDQSDVRAAMKQAVADGAIAKDVANMPDIKYTYDARRDLPAEVEQHGPMTWLQAGKGSYRLRRTKRRNIIRLPDDIDFAPTLERAVDNTPPFIAALLGRDEQAVFTRVRNCGLIGTVLAGVTTYPIQGHHRTTVSYGQIEVDEVQAGLQGDQLIIVPISGKGGQDKLSWSQALNLNTYGVEKVPARGTVRSIGLWRDAADTIWIVEFTPELDIDEIRIANVRRFKFQ